MPFTDLSQHPDVMQRVLRTLGLAAAGEEVHATPLVGGVSSGIYRVRLRSGSYCVKQALPQLRVAKEWKVPVERARFEYEWLRVAARIVPADRLLVETDAPYLAPEPYRGKPNEPAYVTAVGAALAAARTTDAAEIAALTHANAVTVFGT